MNLGQRSYPIAMRNHFWSQYDSMGDRLAMRIAKNVGGPNEAALRKPYAFRPFDVTLAVLGE